MLPDWWRAIPIIAVSSVLVALVILIGIVIARGTSGQEISVPGLIAFVSILIGLLGNLISSWQTQRMVNGHLQSHVEAARQEGRNGDA